MRRRAFIWGLGAAAMMARSGRAQAAPVIGYLSSRSPAAEATVQAAVIRGLEEAGFKVGRDVVIEYRFSNGGQNPAELAAELVGRRVAVLLATDRPAALAAKSATATVPLIFSSGDDPVGVGLVPSLSTPGGNATGVSVFTNQLGPKRLELLREILPRPGVIAFVVNPNNESTPLQVATMESAAKAMGQPIVVVRAGTEDEVEAAFAAMQQRQLAGIVYGATTFYQVITERLVALAARHRIPAAYEWGDAVAAGGLMSYATDRVEIGRQMGAYAAQILKGAKPVDLPVVQSSKFVFALNLKTAKALGLAIPPSLLARADEVIE